MLVGPTKRKKEKEKKACRFVLAIMGHAPSQPIAMLEAVSFAPLTFVPNIQKNHSTIHARYIAAHTILQNGERD